MSAEATALRWPGRLGVLAQLAPTYLVHLTLRPFRRDLADAPVPADARRSARHSAAALDAWFGQVLGTYARLAGIRLCRESGPFAMRYVRLAAALNREFEHRLATGQPLDFAGLCAAPLVAARVAQWRCFAVTHTAAPDVVEFLSSEDVTDDYDRYVAVTTRDGFAADPELQMESIRLDSGGYLARLIRLVGRFNSRSTTPHLLQQFHDLGIAAKLTDELTDLATDHAEGRYNLLLALLGQEPGELAAVLPRLNGSLPMPLAWWRESAPLTFARFAALYGEYHGRLRSPDLKRACDATMLRALGGPKHQRRGPSRHVSEPPHGAWR